MYPKEVQQWKRSDQYTCNSKTLWLQSRAELFEAWLALIQI